MASLGVLLVVVCALAGYALAAGSAESGSYLAVYLPVSAGARISAGDLQAVRITTARGLTPIPASQLDTVVGQYATTGLPAGSLLVPADLARTQAVAAGQGLVGIQVGPTQRPGRPLRPGDRLRLVAQPDTTASPGGAPPPLPDGLTVTVVDVTGPDGSNNEVVDVLVPDAQVTAVSVLAEQGRIVAVLVAAGE